MREIPDFDDREWNPPDDTCRHGRTGYCFDCVRERHNQECLDGKYDDLDDMDADFASRGLIMTMDSDNSDERRIEDEIETTRLALYADKSNEQMIMLALIDILKRIGGAPVIIRELYVRYRKG